VDAVRARSRRLARLTVSTLSVLLAAALVLAGVAWLQTQTARRQQQTAVARGLVAQAEVVREQSPRLALQLGVAAERLHPSPETEASLNHTLTSSRYAAYVPTDAGPILSAGMSADSTTLATGSEDGTVTLWDISHRDQPQQLGEPFEGDGMILSLALSADGATLAGVVEETATLEETAILWDVSDPGQPRQLIPPLGGERLRRRCGALRGRRHPRNRK
jgi:hypothetical protein